MKLRECFDSLALGGQGASVKFANFFDAYDSHFYHIRERVLTVMEIGVQGGGSLALWHKYFPNLRKVVGIDTHDACSKWARPGVSVHIGDASDRAFMEAVCEKEGGFDLIIDDGSHMQDQVCRAFYHLWPHLNDNGWYIIEDTQCAYWERLGGGLKATGSSVEMCKDLADIATWWAIEKKDESKKGEVEYDGQIRAVHFHPAAVFIEKGPERSHHLHYAFSNAEEQKDWEEKNPNVYAKV